MLSSLFLGAIIDTMFDELLKFITKRLIVLFQSWNSTVASMFDVKKVIINNRLFNEACITGNPSNVLLGYMLLAR